VIDPPIMDEALADVLLKGRRGRLLREEAEVQ
jgi:hypothetical protein